MTKAEASALEESGVSAYQSGNPEKAVEDFRLAHRLFEEAGNPIKAAAMANNLCVVLLELDRPEEALKSVEETPQVMLEAGELQLAGQAFGNRATAKAAGGYYDSAEQDFIEAIGIFNQTNAEELLSHTLKALSKLQLKQGRSLEAVNTMQRALQAEPKPGVRARILQKLLNFPSRFLPG